MCVTGLAGLADLHGASCPLQATVQMRSPARSGASCSRPVSRILSRVTIHLGRRFPGGSSGVPGSSAGRLSGACSPCTGRGLASRRVTTALVGSYPTLSPLPSASPERSFAAGGLLSVPLSVGFRRLGFPQRPALRCPDFPRDPPKRPARGHPACTVNCSPDSAARRPRSGVAALAGRGSPRARVQDELAADEALEARAAHRAPAAPGRACG